MNWLRRGAVCLAIFCVHGSAWAGLATFDDLPALPALDGSQQLFFSNNSSDVYQGVTWDTRVTIVGEDYRVDTGTPGPLFGLPNSGSYFITNGGVNNDGILITTNQVLTGAWFGQNEYYGFGSGSDQVTIHALNGNTILQSVVFDLPAPAVAGQPGAMGFADTSAFAALVGITGYRIDRRELGAQSGNWVADDFNFVAPAAVPEPSTLALLGVVATAVAARRRRSTLRKTHAG